MHAILQLCSLNSHDAIQEEGIERNTILRRKSGIDPVETLRILAAHIRRSHDADQQDWNIALLQPGKNAVEVFFRLLRRDPAQGIVGPEFEDDAIRAVRHRPIYAGQATRGRIARDARIGDDDILSRGLQGCFELRRVGLARGQFVSGHQTVSETYQLNCRLLGTCRT